MKRKFNFNKNDFEFMQSTSSAILEESPKKLRIVLQFWIGTVLFALIWAGFAPIDEIVRGDGKVIPGGENQMIQHLEGGIIESILVKEGQKVNIDDVLMKIQNQKSSSTFESSQYKVAELRARIIRLKAEASGGVFSPSADDIKKFPLQIAQERNLYNTNRERLSSEISSLNDQYAQKKNEIIEVKGRMDQQKKSLQLTKEEVSITEPLVAQGIKPKVEFLRLQRSLAEVTAQYNSSADSLPRLNSAISEIGNKIKAARLDFASKAQTALNEAQTDYNRIGAETIALEDQVTRTSIKSPISGIVQKLYVNTIGGVVKPGDNLVEIVPTEGGLLIEAKVKPSDIAFIYPGQKAIIKVTAYDFSIYGSLEGKVVTISPDTVTDKNNNVYYSTFAHKT